MLLTPAFLIAAAAGAAIPLILHLMQNRRRVSLPFPTLRFLKEAQKQSSRRIRLENLLLWLLRTLIMLVLGLAFAMPMLRSSGLGWLGDAPRDVGLVIDTSYSMGYNAGRQTVWERTIETARSLVEGLGENDRFCIYLAGEQPEALIAEPISDKEEGLNRLKNIEPAVASSQLAPALTETVKALRKDGRQREREVFILTDNQAIPWQSFAISDSNATAAPGWDADQVFDDRTTVFVAMLGVSAPENMGPASIDLQPSLVRIGSTAQVRANLLRSGQSAETTVTLFVDDEQRGRRSARLDSADEAAPVFLLPQLQPGIHGARIETPDDNLPIDNAFHFLIRVEDQLPSLCVGTQEDSLFVRTALQAGAGPGSQAVDTVSPERLAQMRLDDYACIVLCNALPLPGQPMQALEDYVRRGGLLALFPGAKASPDDYQAWSCLPGIPAALEEVPLAQRRRTLTWDEPQHMLLSPLRRATAVPTLTVRRRLAWDELHEDSARLISMGADQPFLLERPFGDGRVLMFAVAADRSWSDYPLSPFYLPLILQCLDYSAGFGSKVPFLWATDSLPLETTLTEATRETTLRNPDHKTVPIRSTVEEGRTLLVAEDLGLPGIYTISSPREPVETPALAINIRRRESDLTPLPLDQVGERLGLDELYLATDPERLAQLVEEHRVGRTYGEHLLWLALALIAFEFFYANLLLRKIPRLSDQLGVDPSGRVKAKAKAKSKSGAGAAAATAAATSQSADR